MRITNAQNAAAWYGKVSLPESGGTSANAGTVSAAGGTEKQNTDVVDISAAGREALQKSGDTTGRSYDLAKVLQIHEKRAQQTASKDEIDYYWKARESDPALDAQLYAQDKAQVLDFVNQVQSILLKATTGAKLTPEEQRMVEQDPALQQEIALRQSKSQITQM